MLESIAMFARLPKEDRARLEGVAGRISVKKGSILFAGILGGLSWALMAAWTSPILFSVSLAGFGLGFVMIHPILVATAQECMPQRRGTVMSLVSFSMFVAGGIGTFVNGRILKAWGFELIFAFAAILILAAGAVAATHLRRMAAGHGS